MDQSEFEALIERGKSIPPKAQAAQGMPTSPAPAQPPAADTPAIDFEALSGAAEAAGLDLGAVSEVLPQGDQQEALPTDPTELDAQGRRPDGTLYSEPPKDEPGLLDPQGFEAPVGGGLKSVFETGDFLFGDTPPEQKTDFRKNVEGSVENAREQSVIDGVAAGFGQFAGAMFGLGKFSQAARLLPWFGKGMAAIEASKKGITILETGKAALAGAIAFDPWEERLSNMLAGTPIAGPAFEWLAADPEDSEMEGRFKAALESIALDATLIGVFLGGGRVYKYLRKGDADGAAREVSKQEAAQAAILQEEAASAPIPNDGGGPAPNGGPVDVPVVGDPAVGQQASKASEVGAIDGEILPPVETSVEDGHTFTREGPDQPWVYQKKNPDDPSEQIPFHSTDEAFGGGADMREAGAFSPTIDGEYASVQTNPQGAIPGGEAPSPTGSPETVSPAGPTGPSVAGEAAEAAPDKINPRLGRLRVTDEDTDAILKGMEADIEALAKAEGSHTKATDNGYNFAHPERIPYEKLNNEVDIQNFLDRVVEAKQESIDRVAGGAVMSDARVDKTVAQIADLYNESPALVLGAIQKAGRDASQMVAMMETGYLVTSRIFQDAHALAARISLGDYTGWGNREGATAELRRLLSVGASVYAASRSITANAGRGVRRMRWEFSVDPAKVDALMQMDGEELTKLMVDTGGDIKKISRVANPSWWDKSMTGIGWLLVNNLVSGPKTQLINMMSNSYMLGIRPMERIIGGALKYPFTGNGAQVTEAIKQYSYMGTAFTDGFRFAVKAFLRNDSILNPHNTELFQPGQIMGQAAQQATRWKPWTSPANILSNALTVATRGTVAAVGLPTRILGTVDEAVKQTVYRSKVMAQAHIEGMERVSQLPKGTTEEAKRAFLRKYVRDRVDASVDDLGRGLDAAALREAQITTFQQDLLPGSFGRSVQSMVARHPSLRFILPFVKTPTNVLRYGWKMTPGLNLLQTEYRGMLMGKAGAEAQAQAVGQMALGTLYMGSAAYLVSQGTVTGAGPSDYRTKGALMDTGWQEYSFIVTNKDGSHTYVPYNRYDPVAMPIGIISDIQTAIDLLGEDNADVQAVMGALGYALAKQMANKTYLTGVQDFMDVLSDPDPDKIQRWVGRQAANMVPYSAMLRQVNSDPYMREARDMTDRLMAGLPGWSDKVPMRYDWLGEPRLMRKGLWSSDENKLVDNELVRLGLENDGNIITVANPRVGGGVDLRDVVLEDGSNAYAEYQRLSRQPVPGMKPLRSVVAKLMQSEAYRKAPDGDISTKGTRLWLLHTPVSKYRQAALRVLKGKSKVLRDALGERQKDAIDHYSALRGENPRAKRPIDDLNALGEAYNIELGTGGQ